VQQPAPVPQKLPPAQQAPGTIDGLSTARLGGYLTLSGTLATNMTGTVAVDGSYDGTTWFSLATVPATAGSYSARVPLERLGRLHVRVTRPDGSTAVGSVDVTP
jgi:hypothetical protein